VDEAPARRREPVDLVALAADVVGRYAAARVPVTLDPALRPTPGAAPVDGATVSTVRTAAAVPTVTVRVDPAAVRRVTINLVDNAVRHAASGVCVAVSATPGGALLSVTDDGPGIAAADRERVFDRFARLDAGRGRDEGGAGLGLAIVRELVRAHGGAVTLSDAGPGLRAVVTLPA